MDLLTDGKADALVRLAISEFSRLIITFAISSIEISKYWLDSRLPDCPRMPLPAANPSWLAA
ncbi:MAG: hypothetical protein FJY65_00360 [Calditrichaeota bacterium]|nr:hypothetical protein [Calditrichota bacterium]